MLSIDTMPIVCFDRSCTCFAALRQCVSARRVEVRRWGHWCRVYWSSLQCAFYVALFFVFVFFLRVQEQEFAEHQH